MTCRLGVDVGGTFTDLALYDPATNRLEFAKTPSTPSNQAIGVVNGIKQLIERLGVAPEAITSFIHGTTVATNALLERKGARTGLIVTRGFRDVLQIGRQDRPRLYDWRVRRPAPLVPRHLRLEIRERVLYTGEILTPLDLNDLHPIIEQFRKENVEAVAVCLLHSYANPVHEQMIGKVLSEALPHVRISLSSEVLPEFKEYERMSTTTINAFVAATMGRYLRGLQQSLADAGVPAELHVMQSNGGVMGVNTAVELPVRTILSGPAGGVIGSVALSAQAGEPNVISVDMGGTSFDISLTYQGEIRRTQESEIEGLPVKTPMIDIHTLGAGGGSVAWIDPGGALRVGPHSMGAEPGPACYGRGGDQPTVTDANLVLGRINPDYFVGGDLQLDVKAARAVILQKIAAPLNLSLEQAAEGIIRVVNANMVKGIRVVSVAKGYDPREFALVAFGGAGPLHAADLATELFIPRVLVPVAPGVTSALGLLMADLRHDYVRTLLRPLSGLTPEQLRAEYAALEREAIEQMDNEHVERDQLSLLRLADLRYVGQGYELQVPVSSNGAGLEVKELGEHFHELHRRQYGFAHQRDAVEVVNLRLAAIGRMPRPPLTAEPLSGSDNPASAHKATRQVYLAGKYHDAHIYDRTRLRPGDTIDGPAVIEQLDSTTVVWQGQSARVDAYRNLIVQVHGGSHDNDHQPR